MKKIEQTLLEQMHITEIEISDRLKLLSLTPEDQSLLQKCKDFIVRDIDNIVSEFYIIQTAHDGISLLIGDSDTLERLRSAQRRYIMDLFSGYYDAEYVNNRLRIGMVHKRIGVEPKLFLYGVKTLKDLLIKSLSSHITTGQVLETVQALDKLLYFDTTLIFDTYIRSLISEIELAKNNAELYAKSLEQKVMERTRQLEELSRRDPLTNLYNQRSFYEFLRRDLMQAKRRTQPITVMFVDVDNFKEINDQHGHAMGDEILRNVASSLQQSIRDVDTAVRYGGDEFCVILPDCNSGSATKIAERVINRVEQLSTDVTLSIGICDTGPEHYLDSEQLVSLADKIMYQAKQEPGNQISCNA